MKIRKAERKDLARIHIIYTRARELMRSTGNPTQWGDSYPDPELLESDLREGVLYVIEAYDTPDRAPLICGVFAFFPDGDAIYNNIEGKWLNEEPHAAIHRVASSGDRRGVLTSCIEFCLSHSKSLKIDTHPDNKIMQRALEKAGFTLCGQLKMPDGSPRFAYQRCDY